MALTRAVVSDSEDYWGKHHVVVEDVTLDSSYTTGGYAYTAALQGWSEITGVVQLGGNAASAGYTIQYDTVNKKLVVYVTAAGTVTGNVTVVGGGIGEAIGINPDSDAGVLSKAAATNRTIPIATFLGAAPTVAAAALAEAAAATNLSTVKVRLLVLGV